MIDERLKSAKHRTVGVKQTTKAVQKGLAEVVFVARDAERSIVAPLLEACQQQGVEVLEAESMAWLGKACGIDVGASAAAVLRQPLTRNS
ncbi:MAG: ribosomal L7Ae/L30e/S12e/Gadd45 family protein [Clostridia bacterium]|nr:ribosomal L7Ae/L30e/S12e/Gadd45 family protein [Clostridia bacterium]